MKFLIYISLFMIPLLGFNQITVDRTKAPLPIPYKPFELKKVDSFSLKNGLLVLVVENRKLPVVTAELLVDIFPVKEGDRAGLLEFIFPDMLKAGTRTKTKAKIDDQIDETGGYLNSLGTNLQAYSLKRNFDSLLSIMSDICLNPTFPVVELDKLKKIKISEIEAGKDDSAKIAYNVKKAIMYGKNHPYGEVATKETIQKISQNDLKIFYNNYFRPNISYLVLVGDINVTEAKKWAEKYFGTWEKKDVLFPTIDFPKIPTQTNVAIVHRPQAVQSQIEIFHPIDLPFNSSEVISSKVLNQIMGGTGKSRLFLNLCEKYDFSNATYSELKPDRFVGSFSASASVFNEKVDSALEEFLYEFKKVDTQIVTTKELVNAKNYLTGSFNRSFEDDRQIAIQALNFIRYDLPQDYYKNYIKRIMAVRTEDVRHSAQDYINSEYMTLLVVGNSVDFMPEISRFGNVTYYDELGNIIDPPVFDSTNIQAHYIFKKYLHAIGPNKNLKKVKDLSFHGDMDISGATADVSLRYIFPEQFINKVVLEGQVIIQQSIIDNKYTKISNHLPIPLDSAEKQDLRDLSHVFSELDYLSPKNHFIYKVEGTDMVDNKLCYKVAFYNKDILKFINCYDANSFLKVKSTSFDTKTKNPQVSYYKNYKAFNGIFLPTKIVYEVFGGTKLEVDFNKIYIDSGLNIKDLK
ncbi:MAG: pitrilysin family protein [Alphaproteobacteria bacterium]|nr:pitrilysin family protein [Alphaproteobacteria bacterium]